MRQAVTTVIFGRRSGAAPAGDPQIAAENGKPLFLHQRDAHADFMAMMKNFDGRLGPAVVHCFTGSREECFEEMLAYTQEKNIHVRLRPAKA